MPQVVKLSQLVKSVVELYMKVLCWHKTCYASGEVGHKMTNCLVAASRDREAQLHAQYSDSTGHPTQ